MAEWRPLHLPRVRGTLAHFWLQSVAWSFPSVVSTIRESEICECVGLTKFFNNPTFQKGRKGIRGLIAWDPLITSDPFTRSGTQVLESGRERAI